MSKLEGNHASWLQEMHGALQLMEETLRGGTEGNGSEWLTRCAALIGRLGELAGEAEYLGLHDVCTLYQESLIRVSERGTDLTQEEREQLASWPTLVGHYLESPAAPHPAGALVTHLEALNWGTPLSQDDASMLRALLELSIEDPLSGVGRLDGPLDTGAGDVPPRLDGSTTACAPMAEIQVAKACAEAEIVESLPAMNGLIGAAPSDSDLAVAVPPTTLPGDQPPLGIARKTLTLEKPFSVQMEAASGIPEPDSNSASQEIPSSARELVELLIKELPLLTDSQSRALQVGLSVDANPDTRQQAFDIYAEHLERFGAAAGAVGFQGLNQLCIHIRDNVVALGAERRVVHVAEADALANWGPRVRRYLDMPYDLGACRSLVEMLGGSEWPVPLAPADTQDLLSLLRAPEFSQADDESIASRPQQASADDLSLVVPEDVNSELLDAMLLELPRQTQELSDAIQNLARGGTLGDVQAAQRIAHTVKGAGNTVGIRGLAVLTHHLEDILLALSEHKKLPSRALVTCLLSAVDCLVSMCEALTGMGNPPEDAQAVLQEILDWANQIDRQGLTCIDDPTAVAAHGSDTTALGQSPNPSSSSTHESTSVSEPTLAPTELPIPMIRVPATLVDDLLRLAGETIIFTGQLHERLRTTARQAHAMQEQFVRLRQLGAELERFIDISELSPNQKKPTLNPDFDPLEMDQYSELHTHSRMLVEAATDAGEMGKVVIENLSRLDDVLVSQDRLNRETQESLMSARMVPVKSIASRLERVVRQTCRLTGKQAELHIGGTETLLDSGVLNQLVDPLMHMLRNAVDHGIESPEVRAAKGKEVSGTIQVDFAREGNSVVVQCSDDGAGLDLEAIRRRAEEMGLVRSDRELSEEELKRLILKPNFSTRSQATQTSGRGIGMDVVYGQVLSLRGSLSVQSQAGKGCVLEARLPLTMISTHALLVRVDSHVMAISDRGVEQILHGGDGELRRLGELSMFQVGTQAYPLKTIRAVLGLAEDFELAPENPRPVLLVRDETGISAVFVDQVLEGRDLVVKKLGAYVPKLRGIVGVTILGDGAVVPVLDLPELLQIGHQEQLLPVAEAGRTSNGASRLPLALVVDDSLSARRALEQVMADSGYDVSAARDGMEAVELIEKTCPDIVLADLEMPRMNGIELIAHLRAQNKTASLPVIIISSRSTKKHREQAVAAGVNIYLTKPFAEDELLEHVHSLVGHA